MYLSTPHRKSSAAAATMPGAELASIGKEHSVPWCRLLTGSGGRCNWQRALAEAQALVLACQICAIVC